MENFPDCAAVNVVAIVVPDVLDTALATVPDIAIAIRV
jgi:hypothetical protein